MIIFLSAMVEEFDSKVSPTLLIPLYYRAKESERGSDAILHDPKAEELVKQIKWDFSQYPIDYKTSIGCPVRAWYFDTNVVDFIKKYSKEGKCIVVNLGCGFDTRAERLEEIAAKDKDLSLDDVIFVELDLPDVIEYRKKLLPPKENQNYIPMSLFDIQWMKDLISKYGKVNYMFVSEGVFPYFNNDEIQKFFNDLANEFTNDNSLHCEIWFDTTGSKQVNNKKVQSESLKAHEGADLKMMVDDPHLIEQWNGKYKLIQQNFYNDFHKRRWGIIFGYLLPYVFDMSQYCFFVGYSLN